MHGICGGLRWRTLLPFRAYSHRIGPFTRILSSPSLNSSAPPRLRLISVPMSLLLLLVAGCGADDSAIGSDTTEVTSTPADSSTTTESSTTSQPAPAEPEPDPEPDAEVPDTAAEVPPGFVTHGGLELGFSIALPETYRRVDLEEDDLTSMFEESPDLDPALAELASNVVSQGNNALLWAFDFANASGQFVPNLNVIASPRGAFDQPDIYLDALAGEFESLGIDLVDLEQVEHPAGPALRARSRLAVGDEIVHSNQLIVFGDSSVINVTFTSLDAVVGQAAEQMEAAFATFRLTGGI